MGKIKDFYTCKKCSTLLMDHEFNVVIEQEKLSYICPICGTKNQINIKKEKEES